MALSPNLALMEQAARKAGDKLVEHFAQRDALLIVAKNQGDFVSQADEESEKIIVDILREAKPDWGIMAEEGSAIEGKDSGHRWIIDPLDGTTVFLHGIPHWSITIAKQEYGEIVAGMIFDPMMNEMFYAEKGQGAFLNGKKITVSSQQDFKKGLISMNAGYRTFEVEAQQQHADIWQKGISAGATMCSQGGLALQMAYVAAGRYNACLCWKSMPWDFAAGQLIVEEAGGIVTNFASNKVDFEVGEVMAANPVIHQKFAKLTGLN